MKTQPLSSDHLLLMYRSMLRIRRFEERVAELDEAGEIRTPCHYCIGQEAPATGVCEALNTADVIFGTHRSHGHYLAKGGTMRDLMAEIFGRSTGCSSGRGGSMHICDPERGMMGSVPIVAATIPIAAGAGLAAKLKGDRSVAVAFFGDGATEEGQFHESLNLAAVQDLPVIFVCENNLYSSHMQILERRRTERIVDFGTAHGIHAARVDGNHVTEVYQAATEAVEHARTGGGPALLECLTFRWRGHVGPAWDMDVGVKRKDELHEWLDRDPLPRCAAQLEAAGVDSQRLTEIEHGVEEEVIDAVEFAKHSPFPVRHELSRHVYHAA